MSVAVTYSDFTHEQSDALKEQLAFAKRVLKAALDVEVESLEPIARGYNNKGVSSNPLAYPSLSRRCAGCATTRLPPIPRAGPTALIFHTVRHKSQTPAARKVHNSVAAMQLVRENTDVPIAPVYAYDIIGDNAWMVEGKLPGVPMDEKWHAPQCHSALPGGPEPSFSGLGYDAEGKIVLGPTCLAYAEGPFATAKDHYKAWIGGQWEDAQKNPRADGQRFDGLHERIQNFIHNGLDSALDVLDGCVPVFIHADFSLMNTVLSETAPYAITLSSPAPGVIYGGPHDVKPDPSSGIATLNLLAGTTPADLDPSADSFFTYKMDAFLKACNVGTFSTIPHFEQIARLYWFGEFLRPWFFHEGVNLPEEKLNKTKAEAAVGFDKDLLVWGY
ncbi:hypothetical protein C8R43DRAFT_1130322 [Mycena crocata]|nr:hypothetical protein C8R43DRAFT_1130322 [Mycena crocata]